VLADVGQHLLKEVKIADGGVNGDRVLDDLALVLSRLWPWDVPAIVGV
jgi:hypothetical protein